MAHFRGEVSGQREMASRLGSKNSGLRTVAQSFEGDIAVTLYYDKGEDCDRVSIVARHHNGYGPSQTLFDAPIRDLIAGKEDPH